ncbi:MAG: methyltransferase domain-containing protein [Rhodanobacter sp.]
MHGGDDNIYTSAPIRRLLGAQSRVLVPGMQRCFGTHALLLGTSPDDVPPALPLLSCWVRLHPHDGGYGGDVRAAADEPLPFVDDAFGVVLLRHALEVSPAPLALLMEAIRVLEPGGVLALTGVHPISGWSSWVRWRARQAPLRLQMPFLLRGILRKAGMEVEMVKRVGPTWPFLAAAEATPLNPLGGGFVIAARKRRHLTAPLRLRPVNVAAPANVQLSPGTRRSAALRTSGKA